jgi:hypothetical protein
MTNKNKAHGNMDTKRQVVREKLGFFGLDIGK